MDINFYNESSSLKLGWDPSWFKCKYFDGKRNDIKKIDNSIKNKTQIRQAIEAGTNCTKRNS